MIADMDASLRQRLYSRLLDIDVLADCVSTPADALAKLDEADYSVVIADMDLPERGVERMVSRIARLPRGRRPIVLVVAESGGAARSLDVEIVQIVLRRPLNEIQLVELIASCCVRNSAAARRERNVEAGAPQSGDRAIPN